MKRILLIILAVATTGVGARAQLPLENVGRAKPAAVATKAAPVDIEADSLEYLTDRKMIAGTGNVQIREGEDLLRADYITVQTETRDVYARGNVVFRRGGTLWQGQELRYNLKTKQGDFR
jgi:lipopolysaccharide assembly outer membrane protein LptD (OstA)